MKKHCSIGGCEKTAAKRGWCHMHYARWWRHGDASAPGPGGEHFSDPQKSFSARTEWVGDCLIWTGSRSSTGYGQIHVYGKDIAAHRYAWERVNGSIPDGMFVDHRCHNRACANVEHLRLATVSENGSNRAGADVRNRSTGIRNVYPSGSKFRVSLMRNGISFHFGSYSTEEEAAKAAARARLSLFGEFAGKG